MDIQKAPLTDAGTLRFGRYRGRQLGLVPIRYLRWLASEPGFAEKHYRLSVYIRNRSAGLSKLKTVRYERT